MPAAVVLVDFVLSRVGAHELVACSWALREGVLLDLARLERGPAQGPAAGRRRQVEALATRFAAANVHGKQVAGLALALFDATAPALGLPTGARELLEYAALLHDVGHAVDHDRHHRHTYYLIRNADLPGFGPLEIEVMAQVARGHRKQIPKLTDPELRALPAPSRRLVRGLAALLRVADGLDRTHFSVVHGLQVRTQAGRLLIEVVASSDDAELEMWAAERRSDLLARLIDRPVVLRRRRARPARALVREAR
jgi:exopolyphosphatase/guanosine-5'-triphosphate,3'-diphosphate pyrophosphatase